MSNVSLNYLKRFNLLMSVLHALQAVAVLLLSKNFIIPIKTDYLQFNVNTQSLELNQIYLFYISLPYLITIFFVISSLAHLYVATINRQNYESNLKKGINKVRWFEYALSASVMMLAIGMLVGIYDIALLLCIFALTAFMNLMGLVMESSNIGAKKPNWLSFIIGSVAGIIPWIIIAFYFWASAQYGGGGPPTFVYYIFASIFVFFGCFAGNMYLQYRRIGKWKDYLYGERTYIILSLVAKSALAWQVFAGTLRP